MGFISKIISFTIKVISKPYRVNDTSAKSSVIDYNRIVILEKRYKTLLERNGINTVRRRSHFWGQLIHESGLKPIEENLNYSALRLLEIFPKYFNVYTAYKYARQPEMIANKVYGGRGENLSNEGFKYRGRGFIQTTFKRNYRLLSRYTGVDYVKDPDKLLNEPDAMIAALYYWGVNKLNELADLDDCKAITRKINGGLNGYSDRLRLVNQLKITLR